MGRVNATTSYWQVLAAARFGLAAIVTCEHVVMFGHRTPALDSVVDLSAFAAVLGFLLISGYSIAHSLARGGSGFYRRRFVRIYPLYAVAVVSSLLSRGLSHTLLPHDLPQAAANLMFLQTFVTGSVTGNGVIWTLAIEVACYAAAPWLARRSTPTLLALTAASAAAYVAYAAVPQAPVRYYEFLTHGRPLLLLAWAWLAGFVYHRHQDRPEAGVLLVAGMVALITVNPLFVNRHGPLTIVATAAVVACGRRVRLPPVVGRAFGVAGDISYPLYLINIPVFCLIDDAHRNVPPSAFLGAAVGVSAVLLWVDGLIKRPLTNVLNRVERVVLGDRATVARPPTAPVALGPDPTPPAGLADPANR